MARVMLQGGPLDGKWHELPTGEHALPEYIIIDIIDVPAYAHKVVFHEDYPDVPRELTVRRLRYGVLGWVTGRPYILAIYLG